MYIPVFFITIVFVLLAYIVISTRSAVESFVEPVVVETDDYFIKQFQQCSPQTQQSVAASLQKEWGTDSLKYDVNFLTSLDALYVMCEKQSGEFMGCAAVDRKYIVPCISHIYVKPEHRKTGYGRKLFETAAQHSKNAGFKRVHGLCRDELVPYYSEFGCKKNTSLAGFSWMYLDL